MTGGDSPTVVAWVFTPGSPQTYGISLQGTLVVSGESVLSYPVRESAILPLLCGDNPGLGNILCYGAPPVTTRSGTDDGPYPVVSQSGIAPPIPRRSCYMYDHTSTSYCA